MTWPMVADFMSKLSYAYASFPLQVILTGLMVLDFFTGFAAAIGTKTVSSNMSWRGIMKKAMVWGIVAMAMLIEPLFGGNIPIANLVMLGAIVTEGLSILENAGRLGVMPPFILRDSLEKLNKQVQATVTATPSSEVDINIRPKPTAIPGGSRADDPPAP